MDFAPPSMLTLIFFFILPPSRIVPGYALVFFLQMKLSFVSRCLLSGCLPVGIPLTPPPLNHPTNDPSPRTIRSPANLYLIYKSK